MPETTTVAEPFILFELAGTTYALPSRSVKQMEMVETITPVPNALPHVDGVVFSRGQVIPALNLRVRFGFPRIPCDERTRLVVVQSSDRIVGLLVDTAREFVLIAQEKVQPPPDSLTGLSGSYLDGIATLGQRVVLLLNLEAVLMRFDARNR